MNDNLLNYKFEPSVIEVHLTSFVCNTLLRDYYKDFIIRIDFQESDCVLDFGSGCGVLTKKIVSELVTGKLSYLDVSKTWLRITKQRLRKFKNVNGIHFNNFCDSLNSVKYDKIIVHFTLHDFPNELIKPIIDQLVNLLQADGKLIIREPFGQKHGLPLYDIYRALKENNNLVIKHKRQSHKIIGEYVDIECNLKNYEK